jgi:ELWxxDGT repeat protein
MDTNAGQVELVKDINPEVFEDGSPDSSSPFDLVELKGQLYFVANDGESGLALFSSDGTTEGTQLVTDLYPGNYSQSRGYIPTLYGLTEFNDKLYFSANDGEVGNELFVSDGTAEGTQLVKDVRPEAQDGYNRGSYPRNLTEADDKLYFSANDGEVGNELFVSDGTAEGTQLVTDLYPGGEKYNFNSSYPGNLAEFDDKLYFSANDGVHGEELFVSDGTAEGTQLVTDLYPGTNEYGTNNGSSPSNLVEFKDKLYFQADNGVSGSEVFVSDGTAEGTELLVDINPEGSTGSSLNNNLTAVNDKLYFVADDGVHGNELFVSDGTAEGTQLVTDLFPGEDKYGNANSSFASNLVEFNDKLYFTANDGVHGNELFVSDGTAEGTQLVTDLFPGEDQYGNGNSSDASDLTVVGDELFFSANNGQTGTELYKLTVDDSSGGTSMSITDSDGEDIFLCSAEW